MMSATKSLAIAVCMAASAACAGIPGVQRAKIIGTGWDIRRTSPEQILAHADEFDRSGLDGLFVFISGNRADGLDNGKYNTRHIMTASPYSREMLLPRKATLAAFAQHRGLKESLAACHFSPQKRIDWRSDDAWERFARNVAVLAAFARECGWKGLVYDNEDYKKTKQWFYNAEQDGGTFDELRAMARKRGELVGEAMFGAFPEMALVSSYNLSWERSYPVSPDPAERMRELGDLWPSFFEGLVAAAPETVKLVDGDEHAYFCNADSHDFYVHFWNMQQGTLALLSPDMRARYRSRLVTGGGIYLDMFVNPPDAVGGWYQPPAADGTRISRLTANIAQGARVAGDYLWIYGEKGWLIPWHADSLIATNKKYTAYQTWEEQLPGLTDAIRAQTDPVALANEALGRPGAVNLVEGKWDKWQHRYSKGRLSQNGGELVARGVWKGCFMKEIPAVPGHLYAIEGTVKGVGSVTVGWKAKGRQLAECPVYCVPFCEKDDRGWRRGTFAFVVPPDADSIYLMPGTGGQKKDDETRFKDIRLVEIPRNAGNCH